ncbi:outer membrane beta-barrel protein [Stenotrophomonas sp. JAI102]|uniref:outer membrane beta-barrel protein n=1 Tax=Stenotrophomonas sp. JAI102 TaxID=2723077 RepID=UPI0015CB1E7D|nr:outer membrane beta-barrel protein [Stenotrophomonas sp. JAI102]NYF37823.1 opacity protein-like surface antigen [Stenotrophomonas sp. JAI102]
MYIKRSLFVFSLALVATAAHASPADREGAYIYGAVGKTHANWKVPAADAAAGTKSKQRGARTSYNVGAGYRFSPFLAAEGSFENTIGNSRSKAPGTGSIASRSMNIGGLVLMPIGDHVELFGKVAVGSRQQSYLPPKGVDLKTTRQNKFATTPSVGANVYLTDAFALRAEYSIPMSVNRKVQQAAGVEKMRLNSWNVGVSYAF